MQSAPNAVEPLLSGAHGGQQSFAFPGARWREWTAHLDRNSAMLDALPIALDRRATAYLVEDLLPGDVIAAFTAAMIRGHGSCGDGPYRTVEVEGYRFPNNRPGKIADLGPAFFTKWLHFVTARGDSAAAVAAHVLDALVISWLYTRAGVSLRTGYTDDYARYIETLTSWCAPHGLTAPEVEERIFRLIRSDGS